ncbi:TonB-dependent receptor plug domain-containing protein [Flaviaesturariibacter aridisoli]|uniref:TonB-dependent receptor n=1 Tax=Flaviaesturariibacter aridisoli TaxID=2545761 RepID=A0A4R4E7S4_9BACT|nr:TonB-dependent receptor [Flaviaesturariibacter aridisoli]TCZ74121.1 TonB-dependent receptor [Flaviaesturariibacter aridisoli]
MRGTLVALVVFLPAAAGAQDTLFKSSMEEVVVSGTMKPVRRLESPVAVEVYSAQFFRKNPAPSLFESLQQVNGVRPQINCSVCNTGDIHINGLEGPYTMVTIDGMPILSSLSSVYGLFGIPSQLLEKVELIKGPASGLYGSEAIGGLINVITRDPAKAPRFSMNLMSTSWSEHSLDAGARFRLGKASVLTGLHYFNYQTPQDRNGDGFTDVTLQHRVSLFQKWQLARGAGRTATLAARYFYEDRWGGELGWSRKYRGGKEVYGESIYTSRWELIGRYQLPVAGQWHFAFSATGHHQDAAYGSMPFDGDQRILYGQLTGAWAAGKHGLLAGAVTRHTVYDDNSTATRDTLSGVNRPEKTLLPGLFVQDEWKLAAKHTVLLGLRWDHHPLHRSIFTPRAAWKWLLPRQQVLRLNAGTGFRVVSIFTEEHAALTGARTVEIREALKPETSYNGSLNYTLPFGRAGRAFTLDVSAWYTYFYNRIQPDYDSDPNKIIYANLDGHAESRGISMALEGNWRNRLRGNIGVTLQDVATVRARNGKAERERPVLTERFSGTWSLTYSFPMAGLSIDYTGNVYGPMRLPLISDLDPRKPYSPVWSIQNLQVTKWLSKKVEVYGGVKNLLNWTPDRGNPFLIARAHDPFDKNVQYDAGGQVKATAENPYKLTFDPAYVYAPNQGRRVFAGVRLKWD